MNPSQISLIIFLFFFGVQNSFAEAQKQKTIITKITSDFINIKRVDKTSNFIGNVVVEREDFSMLSDKALVYYREDKGERNSSIKKIEAFENVKIFNDEFVATGNYGIYNPEQKNVVLQENVIFNKGTSLAKGEKFIYDLETRKGNLVGQKLEDDNSDKNTKPKDQRVIVIIGDDLKNKKNKAENKND
ncbi:MAG: lipopolysaccharide transport protein LptA [Lentimonas sp.]|jgi:lipopolysaccharide transport protein LptA